jgi:peptide deformylase
VETSLSAESVPLRTPIEQEVSGERVFFSWTTDTPLLHARYRLEWRFRTPVRPVPAADGGDPGPDPADDQADDGPDARDRASDRMRAAGIVQRGAEMLRTPARPFDLPRQELVARGVVSRLFAVLDRVGALHPFRKGMGLAAPQINLGWAAAVVRTSDLDAQPIILLNPRVLETSSEMDEQYEGCLSFFDVRGMVARPLWIEVETTLPNGAQVINRYERALARLVLHEIDHLDGRLYVDRMPAGSPLVPVEEYQETGRPWRY